MYELFDIRPTNKEVAFGVLGVLVFLVVAFSLGYMLGVERTREDVHNNGSTAAGVGNAIESAGLGISTAKSRIDNAAAAADRVEARISDAQGRVEYLKTTADDGRRLIAECQSMLREVRAGGKENAPKN